MSGIWNRVKNFVGLNDPLDEYDERDYGSIYARENRENAQYEPDPISPPPAGMVDARPSLSSALQDFSGGSNASQGYPEQNVDVYTRRSGSRNNFSGATTVTGNVIGMPNISSSEVLVLEPKGFEEAPLVVQHLRDRKTVVLNLTLMEPDQAQRTVDFIAGATYAVDGHQERVGDGIFLFAPSTVTINTSGSIKPSPSADVTTNTGSLLGGDWRASEPPRRSMQF
jgi:cell division inhibitor SepF